MIEKVIVKKAYISFLCKTNLNSNQHLTRFISFTELIIHINH